MAEIMLTEEQTKKVAESFGTVTVLDAKGNVMGRFDPEWTPERFPSGRTMTSGPLVLAM